MPHGITIQDLRSRTGYLVAVATTLVITTNCGLIPGSGVAIRDSVSRTQSHALQFRHLFPGTSADVERIFSPFAETPVSYELCGKYGEYDQFSLDCARVRGRLLVAERAIEVSRNGATLEGGNSGLYEAYSDFYTTLRQTIDHIPAEIQQLTVDSTQLTTRVDDIARQDPLGAVALGRIMSTATNNISGAASSAQELVVGLQSVMESTSTTER